MSVVHDIEELAIASSEPDAEAVAHRLMDQIDRSVAWGTARQRAWSEYYQYVHRYLRDVVRLDPTRALTQRPARYRENRSRSASDRCRRLRQNRNP